MMVLVTLSKEIANGNNKISLGTLVKAINLSESTVKRSLRWLVSETIVTVEASGGSPNTYGIRVTSDLGRGVTHDRGVTGDRGVKTHVSPGQTPDSNNVSMNSTSYLVKSEREEYPTGTARTPVRNSGLRPEAGCARTEEGPTVIFGQDPDEVAAIATVVKPQRRYAGTGVSELASYFLRHSKVLMRRTFDRQEQVIVRRTMKLLLEAGISPTTIKAMVDKFFLTQRFLESPNMVYLFASREIQDQIMSTMQVDISVDNPVLEWMLTFHRDGVTLPWPQDSDEALERAIIRHGITVSFHYPELVADLSLKFSGDFTNTIFTSTLRALDDIVRHLSGLHTLAPEDLHHALITASSQLSLPKELTTLNASKLRPGSSTISEAIYTYRRHRA